MKKKKHLSKKIVSPRKAVKAKKENPLKQYIPYFFLLLILLFAAIVRSKFISIPFDRDEGAYAYLGQLILDGKTPYIDFYELKLPGLFYAYAAILWVFGNTFEQLHGAFLVFNLASIIIIFFIGKKFLNDSIALVISTSFAILSLCPQVMGFTIEPEHLIVLLASGGFLLLLDGIRKGKMLFILLSGALISFSFLVKQSAVFFIIMGGLAIILRYWHTKPHDLKSVVRNVLIYSAGVLLVFLIFVIVIMLQGSFDEMLDWTFKSAGKYVSKTGFEKGLSFFKIYLVKIINGYLAFWVLGIAGLILVFFLKISTAKKIVISLFAVLSFLTIVPGLHFYGHYWIQLLPALSLMIGITLMFVIQMLSKAINPKASKIVVFTAFILMVIIHLNDQKKYYFNPDFTVIHRDVYNQNPFLEAKVIGDFIKENTDENDKIAIFGSEPQIFIYSGRRSASKHFYIAFLMGDTLRFPNVGERQQEFIDDLIREKPKFLVYYNHPLSIFAQHGYDKSIYQKFNVISGTDYNMIGIIDMISMYNTKYVWYDELQGYKYTGEYNIFIFERKD